MKHLNPATLWKLREGAPRESAARDIRQWLETREAIDVLKPSGRVFTFHSNDVLSFIVDELGRA